MRHIQNVSFTSCPEHRRQLRKAKWMKNKCFDVWQLVSLLRKARVIFTVAVEAVVNRILRISANGVHQTTVKTIGRTEIVTQGRAQMILRVFMVNARVQRIEDTFASVTMDLKVRQIKLIFSTSNLAVLPF